MGIVILGREDGPHWIDNHPDRYEPIEEGDYVVVSGLNEQQHFVRCHLPAPQHVIPTSETVCGIKLDPDSYREYRMGGIVDCDKCLDAMKEAHGS